MTIAIYPGSFDPITYGHLDIVERAVKIFDEVIIAVMFNPSKHPMFTVDERRQLIRSATSHIKNVRVDSFPGLLVDYMSIVHANVIVKGLRAISDYESEFQMASMNRKLNPAAETFFMATSSHYSYLSSSIIKEIAMYGGNVTDLVPLHVEQALRDKLQPNKEH